MYGGYTLSLPEQDQTLVPKKKLLAEIIGLLGGRVAEEIVFDDITSGAANDIERVTMLARNMVTRLGMSEALGPMVYGQKEELIFLGREISEQRDYSEAIAEKIDNEVRRVVNDAYTAAKGLINKYRKELDAIAGKLLEVETLSREEFDTALAYIREKGIPFGDAFDSVGKNSEPGIESGARGVAPTVYLFDPNKHLIEIRTYD
jgi:cell division protease FtsH